MLTAHGPTLIVNIGFDPTFDAAKPGVPIPGISGVHALVDTGASQSFIDSMLASQLGLPVVDKVTISGISGGQETNMYLAQVHIPSLPWTIYGLFAGVHLAAGGMIHKALIGRTFLQSFTMTYNGKTGNVDLSSD